MYSRLLLEAGVRLDLSPRTRAWQARLAAIPAVADTVAEASAGLEAWIADRRGGAAA
jgi:hypothetical protein